MKVRKVSSIKRSLILKNYKSVVSELEEDFLSTNDELILRYYLVSSLRNCRNATDSDDIIRHTTAIIGLMDRKNILNYFNIPKYAEQNINSENIYLKFSAYVLQLFCSFKIDNELELKDENFLDKDLNNIKNYLHLLLLGEANKPPEVEKNSLKLLLTVLERKIKMTSVVLPNGNVLLFEIKLRNIREKDSFKIELKPLFLLKNKKYIRLSKENYKQSNSVELRVSAEETEDNKFEFKINVV